jgi:hypothetical protein
MKSAPVSGPSRTNRNRNRDVRGEGLRHVDGSSAIRVGAVARIRAAVSKFVSSPEFTSPARGLSGSAARQRVALVPFRNLKRGTTRQLTLWDWMTQPSSMPGCDRMIQTAPGNRALPTPTNCHLSKKEYRLGNNRTMEFPFFSCALERSLTTHPRTALPQNDSHHYGMPAPT